MKRRIPKEYVPIVKKALIGAAGVSPLGLVGAIDAVGVGAVWTAMFVAIRNKANSNLGSDPKRIGVAVATGLARYYLGCKAATFAFFCLPGVGVFVAAIAALGISAVCNIYFTYTFAVTLTELMNKQNYSDDDIIKFFINQMRKLPNVDEVKEIGEIYRS